MKTERLRSLALVAALVAGALGDGRATLAATVVRHRLPTERPTRTIAVIVNGSTVTLGAEPIVVDRRLYLPLRSILTALGIPLVGIEGKLTAGLPAGAMALRVGSSTATIDGAPVALEAPVIEHRGVTYVPYGLMQRAFAGAISYDQRGATIEIVSPYFVDAPPPGGSAVTGTVAAVDRSSEPNALTIVAGGNPRTIALTSAAKISFEDVSIRTEVPGAVAQIQPGDAVHAVLAKNGRVLSVHDFFKSTSSAVAAASPTAVVLQSGLVVRPGRDTVVVLNDAPAAIGDLAIGDFVTIRSNPETGELRQIIANRSTPPTAAPASTGAAISAFAISSARPLRAGESFDVTMAGTPGGHASFDIGEYLVAVPMREASAGEYRANFVVPDRFNLTQVPVYGHLDVAGAQAPRAEAQARVTTLTTPPQIDDFAPRPGNVVNNSRPTIYAAFSTPAQLGIDPQSIELRVGGRNVSAEATRTPTFVIYTPQQDMPAGATTVTLRLRDPAGNAATKSWSFVIGPNATR